MLIRPRLDMINIADLDLRRYDLAKGERAADRAIHNIQRLIQAKTRSMRSMRQAPLRKPGSQY